MNQGLFNVVVKNDITMEEGIRRSPDPEELQNMLGEGVKSYG